VKFIYEQATKKTIKTYQLHSPDIVVGENTQQRQWWFYSTAIPTRAKDIAWERSRTLVREELFQ
jgi:hypothetical protein